MDEQTLSRRNFLKTSAVTGAVFSLGFYWPANAKSAKIISTSEAKDYGIEMNSWVHIDKTGKVTIFDHRAEMGQGSYQAVPQIVAVELEVHLNEINVAFAQGDNKKYGSQITGGSSIVRGTYKNLLKLSATAREMLIQAAATKWAVAKIECYAEGGHVIHRPSVASGSPKRLHYGELG